VVDILDREVELIFVAIVGTAILSATIGQDPIDVPPVLINRRPVNHTSLPFRKPLRFQQP
jgi:hypothetical protein